MVTETSLYSAQQSAERCKGQGAETKWWSAQPSMRHPWSPHNHHHHHQASGNIMEESYKEHKNMAIAIMDSQQLGLLAQELYEIKPDKSLNIDDGIDDLKAPPLIDEVLAVGRCWRRENHAFWGWGH